MATKMQVGDMLGDYRLPARAAEVGDWFLGLVNELKDGDTPDNRGTSYKKALMSELDEFQDHIQLETFQAAKYLLEGLGSLMDTAESKGEAFWWQFLDEEYPTLSKKCAVYLQPTIDELENIALLAGPR